MIAQAVLHIWADKQGAKAPTALDIALYFENQEEWTRVMEEQWNRIGLGLPFSRRLRDASLSFFSACATRAHLWGPSIALQNATRALQPTEALKQARLKHLAWVATFPSRDPIEVRSRRHDQLPQTAKPSKMKPELPGFTGHGFHASGGSGGQGALPPPRHLPAPSRKGFLSTFRHYVA